MIPDFDESIKSIIGLTNIEGVGHILAKRLVLHFGTPQAVFKATRPQLLEVKAMTEPATDAILQFDGWKSVEDELMLIKKNKVDCVTFLDADYPWRLKECEDGPLLLFYKGDFSFQTSRMLSVVGTRTPTPYGIECVERLIHGLKGSGVVVVSGLAVGIDGHVHRACLENDIPTIGVVAHGLDRIYPPVHRSMAGRMMENGGIVTEFYFGTNPDRENFPKRNRIIAGMTDGTIVIETQEKGGSMITADLAQSYFREVMCFPGRAGDERSVGCNWMIKHQKAAMVESADDVLELMGWTRPKSEQADLFSQQLSEQEQKVIQVIRKLDQPSVDHLIMHLGVPVHLLTTLLLEMEFKGLVKSLPGMRYALSI